MARIHAGSQVPKVCLHSMRTSRVATAVVAGGSRIGSAAGIASAALPSTETAATTERPRGQHSDHPRPLDETVEQLAEVCRDVAIVVKVHTRRRQSSPFEF